jgi:uncharacterized protein YdeI (YjbR/CyaY-like superfamily)
MAFREASDLRTWLSIHHASEKELEVQIFKKTSELPSITWNECVIECLCFGWIDGRKKSVDGESYLQRITPRRTKSKWSKTNVKHAERLMEEGLMMPSGLAAVNIAKENNEWEEAYAGPADMEIPDDFLAALESKPKAKAFFQTLNRRNLYAIYYRLHTAKKPATRARRMESILDQLTRKEEFH